MLRRGSGKIIRNTKNSFSLRNSLLLLGRGGSGNATTNSSILLFNQTRGGEEENQNQMQQQQRRKKHTLPDLPYDFSALEPIIDAQIMEIHHQKHHNTYVTNLNVTLEKLAEAEAKEAEQKYAVAAEMEDDNDKDEDKGLDETEKAVSGDVSFATIVPAIFAAVLALMM